MRYYVLNAKKPPFDDLNARKAIALALDRPQINAIRNNGIFQVADGPFDKDVPGYVKNPGFPKHNLKAASKLVDAYKAAHGGQFSVVIEHTNDPENSGEGQLMKEQLAKAGIDATLQIEDQSAFINTALSGNFSILLWRNHPGDRIAVGLDVRGETLAARGWTRDGGNIWEVLDRLETAGCSRYVVTDVNKDGMLNGPTSTSLRAMCEHTDKPVIASGGVSSIQDLVDLRGLVPLGVEGAIVGKALYAGAFTPQALAAGASD